MTDKGNAFNAVLTLSQAETIDSNMKCSITRNVTLLVLTKTSEELQALMEKDPKMFMTMAELVAEHCDTANNLVEMSKAAMARIAIAGGVCNG